MDGENCSIRLDNANGDLHTLNNIVDKYIMDDYDLIVTISTPATQAALNKVKDNTNRIRHRCQPLHYRRRGKRYKTFTRYYGYLRLGKNGRNT